MGCRIIGSIHPNQSDCHRIITIWTFNSHSAYLFPLLYYYYSVVLGKSQDGEMHKICNENLVRLPIDKNSGAGICQRAVDLSSSKNAQKPHPK